MDGGAWWAAVHGVAKSQTRLSDFTFTFHFYALKEMATHCSVLAWRLPGLGSHRVGQDWRDLAVAAACLWRHLRQLGGKGSSGWLIGNACHGWEAVKGRLLGIYHAWSGSNLSFYKWLNWNSESWGAPIKIIPPVRSRTGPQIQPSIFPPGHCF